MVERGYRWIHRGNLDQASATFEMTIRKYPNSVLAHLGRADALFEACKDREAVDSYTNAIFLLEKDGPKPAGGAKNEAEVVGARFLSYQNQGLKFPYSLEAYIHLRRGHALEGLAKSDPKLGRDYFARAIADYEKAIELAPNYEEANKHRDRLLQQLKGARTN